MIMGMDGEAFDSGIYNKNQEMYAHELEKLMSQYPEGVLLSPEYAQWVQENQIRLLIRLARYKFVAKLLKPSDSLLEVGCGSGLGTIFLGQHCANAKGIDVKQSEISEARQLNQRENVSFAHMDLFEAPLDEKFDVVVSLDVIEHLTVEQGRRLISEQVRRLKPGGMLVVGSPSVWSYPHQSPISQASDIQCYDLPELLGLVDDFVERSISFSMNDEMIHTGHHKMAWYYMVVGFGTRI